ncbi:helix-turn-helix transcriptional regulator [Weizmannia coagulans]|nr:MULTISPECIES: helix-turn-helix transcriptional regulator [Heyndrickxia]ATW84542.1 XRE family transcriptional regulator [Heyndrickxia coagulans]KGB30181.1 XRE family transcriptional regulator [Heyndrickxia coagulans]KGT40351.1 XRE family transcriptional regulator [Heyndrickxia coagulans P38]KXT21103.1 XRE family transcriptional regulator [Heyndrickxia coagulans]MCR4445434.1 helix-turn-helix domain-containing protein [Heyndrickxia coagulans]
MLAKRLRQARKNKKLTQEQLAHLVKTTKGTISNYENEYSTPSNEMLKDLAKALDVTTDYLLGRSSDLPKLTEKDEKDIAKKMESILEEMDSDTALAFDGEPMDEETRELVRAAIESNLRLTKQIAKKKFTPKKYRKDPDDEA